MTDLTATLLERLDEHLLPAADPVRAAAQAAYMKGQFPFLGLPAPPAKAGTRGPGRPAPSGRGRAAVRRNRAVVP